MTITKKLILNLVLILWVIFSVIYILYDVWSDFKLKALNQAYQQGRADTINALIQQAEKCDPIPVLSGEKRIEVINVNCLKTSPKE